MLFEQMKKVGLDALYISNMNNITYLSGFKGTAGILFITKEATYLITDFRYITQAKEQLKNITIVDIKDGEKEIFEKLIKKHGIKTVGFESKHINYSSFLNLSEIFKNVSLIPTENIVENLRIIKKEEELKYISCACEIADKAFEIVLPNIKAGKSELEIASMIEYEMKKMGAEGPSFETIVASGKRSAMPHGTASEKIIQKGEFVVLDYGCKFHGYCSDITRTVGIGEISPKMQDTYYKVLHVQEESLKNIKEGIKASLIDYKAREMFNKWDIDKYFGHSLGHGVGLDIHELPNLSLNSEFIFEKNMVVTVEPGIYIENEFGVRIEDTVLVDNGANRLTKSTKELIIYR